MREMLAKFVNAKDWEEVQVLQQKTASSIASVGKVKEIYEKNGFEITI